MLQRNGKFAFALLAATLLAACAARPLPTGVVMALPPAPPLPVQGATVYHIVQGQSQIRIVVFRGGAAAEFGHNHVLVTSVIEGNIYLHDKITQSGFELKVPLRSLRVDPPAARRQEGSEFASTVTADDRAGTRGNMLGPAGLDAARYPAITLRSIGVEGPPWQPRFTVRITLHGVSRDYVVPTAIVRGDNRLIAIGALTLRQTDFGITPFSVLGGVLAVQDRVHVSFHLVARRKTGSD